MQRIFLFAVLVGMVCTPLQAWAQLPRFNPNEPLRAEQLNAIVEQLRNVDGGRPSEAINVNCDGGDTIRQALQRANTGDTIWITGTCRESVTITLGGLILDGQGTTTVDGGGQTPITVDTARRVTLRNMIVRNGVRGLQITRGAAVIVENVTAEDNTEHGINVADNAAARVTNSTAQRNGQEGIRAFSGGFIVLNGTVNSMRNTRFGIRAATGSIIQIADATNLPASVTSMLNGRPLNGNPVNGSHGVSLGAHSTFIVSSGELMTQDNTGRGIDVDEHSALRVFAGTVMVTGNTQGGARAQRASYLGLVPTTGEEITVQISGNQANGVDLLQNASADVGNGVQIRDNTGTGINLAQQAQLNLSDVVVRANQGTGGGINLFNGCTARLNNVQILDHVNGSGLNINLQSSVNATNVTIMNNATSDAAPRIFSPGINIDNNSALILSGSMTTHALVSGNRGAGGGINITNGSTANLNNVDITDHPNGRGINVSDKGELRMNNGIISGNGGQHGGLHLFNGGTANLSSVTISENTHAETSVVFLNSGASLSMNDSAVTDNAGSGIGLFNGSVLNLSNTVVSNNLGAQFGSGLNLFMHSSANLNDVQISGDANVDNDFAVSLGTNSSLSAFQLTVTDAGLNVDDSSVVLRNSTIPTLSAFFGARIQLNDGNTIGSINCGGNNSGVLIRGGTCP